MILEELQSKESGIILRVRGEGAFRKRITEMGFIKGQKVTVIKNAPFKDPVEYYIMGYNVSLRRAEAALIDVSPEDHPFPPPQAFNGTFSLQGGKSSRINKEKIITVGLVGNPNSGKTSIFNYACQGHEHVGNYGGVTVDSKLGQLQYGGYTLNIIDLPGTYSLSHYSPEEVYVRDFIFNSSPDIIVNVVDSTNLERNLYLTTQLLDLNVNLVIALNMYDELKQKDDRFDYQKFGKMIGARIVPTVGSRGKGLAQLFEAIIAKHNEKEEERRTVNINYGTDFEESIDKIIKDLNNAGITDESSSIPPRFLAIKLLEKDADIITKISGEKELETTVDRVKREIKKLESLSGEDTGTMISDAKYGFIAGALRETFEKNHRQKKQRSENIDKILTHKYLGLPVFFILLWLMFEATFRLGQFPVRWIETGVSWISAFAESSLPAGDLKDLLIQGVIGGIGGVIVFLPNILILFFFISILEDTGYMARSAFLMDKFMHGIGLHGKSFIPMVMGFGCNVPAILSTRIIESRNNRIITMLILPFMSCSARLPVYILIIGTFFPFHQGSILFGLYLTGIILAASTALLLRRFHFRKEDLPFVMELPPYRIPTGRNTIRHMWNKSYQYLHKIGSVILIASVIIWGLGYYPKNSSLLSGDVKQKQVLSVSELGLNPQTQLNPVVHSSYLEMIGKFIEPVIKPLGFDWKMGVSLLAGVAAKEIVVSTMGVIYGQGGNVDQSLSLGEKLKLQRYSNGEIVYTPAAALSFLMFILIYFPCVAVVVSVARESGSALYSLFLVIYTSGLAWVLSFAVYHLTNLILK
ncbi:MAG: ferrous iron transport protein B [Bacteroidales bacterium]|nr:ferrous iron transport protein B [Bacteroidales bacterium]MCB9012856.1 ferrous iron transport protein B [Bacteroidales bacterium]